MRCSSRWERIRASRLAIPGARLRGTLINTDFLREVRLGAAPDFTGKRVMVLGGGGVAIGAWPGRRSG